MPELATQLQKYCAGFEACKPENYRMLENNSSDRYAYFILLS